VRSAIGAIGATTRPSVTTGVTCPTCRTHPAIIAHAAATSSSLLGNGRVRLGVGSGKALNEHILGDRCPPAKVRLTGWPSRWSSRVACGRVGPSPTGGGTSQSRTRPSRPVPTGNVPVLVSAFGHAALRVATKHGDGWVTASPDDELLRLFRHEGRGPACGVFKVCYDDNEAKARRLAYELCSMSEIPGQLHQDLPTPTHFKQTASIVTEERRHGPALRAAPIPAYVATFREYAGSRVRRGRHHAHRAGRRRLPPVLRDGAAP
jgi:alkanesulfonate monooxygenase SsuD/methylene tetrahydromethanopterin reductase-like flavin-dependent oxidoreductase (luciferase family)